MRVVLIAAQSVDGFIAKHDQPGTAFTSPEDKAWFPACLEQFDCCVMGGATYRYAREDILSDGNYARRRRVVVTRSPDLFAGDFRLGALEFTSESPVEIVQKLAASGCGHCALLGGGEIYGLFLKVGCVDELWLTIEPAIFGEGRPVAVGKLDARLSLREIQILGQNVILIKYNLQNAKNVTNFC